MKKKKSLAVLATAAMVMALLPGSVFGAGLDYTRLAGDDRIKTALEVCEAGWKSADTVILAPADQDNLVDSLAAAPLAGQEDAPILVTYKSSLDAEVKEKIQELGAKKVYVIGAISDKVKNEVDALKDVSVVKLSGADRIATARAITAELDKPAGTFVVGYMGLADALSVSAYAASHDYAIALANSDGSIDAKDLKGSKYYVVGGNAKVKDIKGAQRFAGSDDYGTNEAVAEGLYEELDRIYLANGASLVDALTVAPLAAKYENSFVQLCTTFKVNPLEAVTKDTKLFAVGGAAVVPESIIEKAAADGENRDGEAGAESLNLLQIELDLKGVDYDLEALEDTDNYALEGYVKKKKADIGIVDVDVEDDIAVLTLEKAVDNQSTGTLEVEEAVTGEELTFEKLEFMDKTLPTVAEVKVVGEDTLKVIFSEPIVDLESMEEEFELTMSKKDYRVDKVTSLKNGLEANVQIRGGFDEGTLTVSIGNQLEDYAGFHVVVKDFETKVKKDTTEPEVTGYKQVTRQQVKLIFDEDIRIEDDDQDNYYHSSSKNTIDDDIDEDTDLEGNVLTLRFTDNPLPEGDAYIYLEPGAVADLWGNENDRIKVKVEVEEDRTAPKVKHAEYFGEDQAIVVTFSEAMADDSAEDTDNYALEDDEGDEVRISRAVLKGDKVTLTLRNKELKKGTYELVIQDVEDLAGNEISKTTLEVGIADNDPPAYPKAVYYEGSKEDYTLYVEFGEEMAVSGTYSVNDLSKYEIYDDSAQSYINLETASNKGQFDIDLKVTNSGKTVEITLDGFALDPKKDGLLIARVADSQGNFTEGFGSDKLSFVGAEDRTILFADEGVTATARDTIEVEFDGRLDEFNVKDFYIAVDGDAGDYTIATLERKSDARIILTLDEDTLLPADLKEGRDSLSLAVRGGRGDRDYEVRSESSSGAKLQAGQEMIILDKISPDVLLEDNKDTSRAYRKGENGSKDGIAAVYGTYEKATDLTFVTVELTEPVRSVVEDMIQVNDGDFEVVDVIQDGSKGILEFIVEGELLKGDEIEFSILRDDAGNYNSGISVEIEYEVD